MLIGTLFTLVLLPAIYALLASDHPTETDNAHQPTLEKPDSPVPV